jgi:hypothetical protein
LLTTLFRVIFKVFSSIMISIVIDWVKAPCLLVCYVVVSGFSVCRKPYWRKHTSKYVILAVCSSTIRCLTYVWVFLLEIVSWEYVYEIRIMECKEFV